MANENLRQAEKEVVPDLVDGGIEGNSSEVSRPSEENIQEVLFADTLEINTSRGKYSGRQH